jgi:hypothetical protein
MPRGPRGSAQGFENLPAATVDQAGDKRRKKWAQASDRPASRKECAQVSDLARLTPKGSSNWDPAPSAGPRGVSSLSEIPLLSDIPFR